MLVWAGLVAVTVLAGALGYALIEGWPFFDALYMTVTTVTTVGFREVHPLTSSGRVWTMALLVAGIGLVFGGVGIVAEYVPGEVLSGRREERRMAKAIAELREHYVLCGYGRVGSTVAHELATAELDVVIVDRHPESVARARAAGFLCVEGDATEDGVLQEAGITRARGLIASIDTDANNVYVILSARALNPRLFVVSRAAAPGAEAKLGQAGADRVVSPYTMAGRRIAELARRPGVVDFIDAALSQGELSFSMEEVTVSAGGPLEGRTVGMLRDGGIFTLAVVRGPGDYEPHPAPDRRLLAGETLILSGDVRTLDALRGPTP